MQTGFSFQFETSALQCLEPRFSQAVDDECRSGSEGNVVVAELSSGIWKALLTTAAGLAVAVPALAAHSYLASQIDRLRLQVSNVIQRVLYVASKPVG